MHSIWFASVRRHPIGKEACWQRTSASTKQRKERRNTASSLSDRGAAYRANGSWERPIAVAKFAYLHHVPNRYGHSLRYDITSPLFPAGPYASSSLILQPRWRWQFVDGGPGGVCTAQGRVRSPDRSSGKFSFPKCGCFRRRLGFWPDQAECAERGFFSHPANWDDETVSWFRYQYVS